jgi:hypothetical protein
MLHVGSSVDERTGEELRKTLDIILSNTTSDESTKVEAIRALSQAFGVTGTSVASSNFSDKHQIHNHFWGAESGADTAGDNT